MSKSKATLFKEKKEQLCPECGALLIIRNGKQGPFQGCSRYPECTYIHFLTPHTEERLVKILDSQFCPCCSGVLVLKQGRFGMFIGCSHYPNCDYVADIDKPSETIITCPECKKGRLLQRKSRYGKLFYACDRYPVCQFTINSDPVIGTCAVCGYSLLIKKRTLYGSRILCANKMCGKEVSAIHDDN